MKRPRVSVIVTTKNEERVIGNLLESLKKQTYKPLQIIVVDNNSTDRTKEIARRYTKLVFNQGPERSRQRNFGAKKAKGKYILILDADMELEPGVVEECVARAESDSEIKAVVIPEKSFGIGFWAKCKALERNCYLGDELIEAARFFDKKTFLESGGYDERITGPEDWDLPQRIRKKYKIGRIESFIHHNEGKLSLLKTMRKKYYYAQKFAPYLKKHPRIARRQANLLFRPAFFRNWRNLLRHPILALGVFFMRACEMMAGGFGYLGSLVFPHRPRRHGFTDVQSATSEVIVITSHAVFAPDGEPIHGTGSEIGTFLQKKQLSYFFIKHSLYGDFSTLVDEFLAKKLTHQSYGLKNLPFLLKIIQDQIINFYFVFKPEKKIKLFIGIDPLNAFSGILAKKIGKVKKTVFYTADYAHQRFANPILNWIYHWFDRFAIKHADQVWNVSTRITKLREKQGVPKEKNFFVPNAPIFKKVKRLPYSKINQHDLVIVSHLTGSINYSLIFKVIKKLSSKYKKIRLLIIGRGPDERRLKDTVEKMKMTDRILFLGRKSHDEVLKILSRSAIGIALYTKEQPWREFCDSLKIREYFACGLPVITTDVPSTADDVRKAQAGLVIKLKEKEFEKAVDQLFSDKKLYLKMRRNGIGLARKYDFFKVISKILDPEINSG